MKKIYKLIFVVFYFIFGQSQHLGQTSDGLEIFKIDLDNDPVDRFTEPALYFKQAVHFIYNIYKKGLPEEVSQVFEVLYNTSKDKNLELIKEIEGIAKALDLPASDVLLMNFLYEVNSQCTSIIARDVNGKIMMLRNLDFFFANETRDTLYLGKFYKNGKFLFEAPMFTGVVGVYTGYKPGGFAVAINWRKPEISEEIFLENLGSIFGQYTQISQLVRQALIDCQTYICAFEMIKRQPIVKSAYVTLAGTNVNDGAIITRDWNSTLDETKLNSSNWYLVQTNHDHFSGICPIRCQTAKDKIETIGQDNITIQNLLDQILLEWPNLNYETIYTSMFVVQEDFSRTIYSRATNLTVPEDLKF